MIWSSSEVAIAVMITGFKGFKMSYSTYGYPVLSCRNHEFMIGMSSWIERPGDLKLCRHGFHYCRELADVFTYYEPGPAVVYGQVQVGGNIIDGDDKSCASILRVTTLLNGEFDTSRGYFAFKDGRLHKDDGPAFVSVNGDTRFYIDGFIHREDGPAIITWLGRQEWRKHGRLHRLDGPAIIDPDGTQEWYCDGDLHRLDGPAAIYPDGTQEWYVNGDLHRLDGPAVVRPDGTEEWCVNGDLHRLDGPAIIRPDGTQKWYLNGYPHRTGGPAVVLPDGRQAWCDHGKFHIWTCEI